MLNPGLWKSIGVSGLRYRSDAESVRSIGEPEGSASGDHSKGEESLDLCVALLETKPLSTWVLLAREDP